MIRALTTLVGLAAAAAILYFVTDIGSGGGSYWLIALVWAGAGLALGVLYQGGGRRGPGLRMNVPLLLLAFLPWTLLTAALVAITANKPVWLANRGRDLLPDAWIGRWEASLPAFALVSGLLLAFSLIEPRIGVREPRPVDSANAEIEPYTPYQPVTAVQPAVSLEPETVVTPPDAAETIVTDGPPPIDEHPSPRLLSDGSGEHVENPVQVIHPEREGHADV